MDRKTLPLVILLVIAIVFYGQILEFLGLVEPPAPAPVEQTDSSQVAAPPPETLPPTPTTIAPSPAERQPSMTDQPIDSIVPDTITVVTNKYEVILSSVGAGPVSLKLQEYTYRDGTVIEMMPEAEEATPVATFAGGTFSTGRLPFVSNLQPGRYDATSDTVEIVYTHNDENGGQLRRILRFYPDSYHYDLIIEVDGTAAQRLVGPYSIIWNTPLGVTEPQDELDYQAMEAVTMQGGSRESLKDWDNDRLHDTLDGYTAWVGVRQKYFSAVMIPHREGNRAFADGIKEDISTPEGTVEARRITAGMYLSFAGVESMTDTITVFVGPLDYMLMSEYDVGLEDMLDIGTSFLGWLIKPFAIGIMWLLPRMYELVPNYGLVTILFALLVKIITLPLSMRSFKSMAAMRELQPKMEELRQKHKKNPQALNQEMMKLYKKHGVNPIASCLPMLPQMPLLFAMFSVFRSTILLRNAPFVWFIDDLSRGVSGLTDPYMILVVFMVVAQFISQAITMPSTQQNKMMMYLMPLFFGWMTYMWHFSAGLILYWICFSVFSLLDYVLFKRKKNVEVKTA